MKFYTILGAIMLALIAYGMSDANDKANARNAENARIAAEQLKAQRDAAYQNYLRQHYARERAQRARIVDETLREMQLDRIERDVHDMRMQQQMDAIR